MNTFPTPGLVPARKSLPVLELMMLKNIMQHVEKRNQEDLAMPKQAASELKLTPAAHAKCRYLG